MILGKAPQQGGIVAFGQVRVMAGRADDSQTSARWQRRDQPIDAFVGGEPTDE